MRRLRTDQKKDGEMELAIYLEIHNPIPINSGVNCYSYQLANDLSNYYRVKFFYTYNKKSEIGLYPKNPKFEIEHLKSRIKWIKISKKLEMIKPEYFIRVPNSLKNLDPQVIFTVVELYHIARKIKNNDVPVVIVMHNIEWIYAKSNFKSPIWLPLKIYEDYVLKKADAIVCISPKEFEYALKVTKDSNKIFYFPPTLEAIPFSWSSCAFNYGKDKFNVLFYGSLDREHNRDAIKHILNELIPELKKRGKFEEIRINIFGSGEPPQELIRSSEVKFYGEVDDVIPYVKGADIVIIPVRNPAGVKIRILESYFCNKIILAFPESTLGLPPEIKRRVISCKDSSEMAEKIIELLNCKNIESIKNNNAEIVEEIGINKIDDLKPVIEYLQKKNKL